MGSEEDDSRQLSPVCWSMGLWGKVSAKRGKTEFTKETDTGRENQGRDRASTGDLGDGQGNKSGSEAMDKEGWERRGREAEEEDK
jgi:hypothetical protein